MTPETSSQSTEQPSTRPTPGSPTTAERRRLLAAALIWAIAWGVIIVLGIVCILILR